MGSQTLEVVRLGLWASLTGGWFYDPHQGLFTNTVHFYLWMFLVLLPFSLYMGTPASSSTWVWALYSIVVGFCFLFAKLLNHRLHVMFDGEEIPTNSTKIEGEPSDDQEIGDVDENEHRFPHANTDEPQAEAIELQEIQVDRPASVTTSEDGQVTRSNQNMQEPAEAIQPLEEVLP